MSGWIKIHRQLLDWEWYSDIPTCRLFLHLILRANHKPKKWKGILIGAGEVLSGRNALAKDTGLSPQQIRSSLAKLERTHNLTIRTTNKYSVYSIVNYNKYQLMENKTPATHNSNNQQLTTNKKEIIIDDDEDRELWAWIEKKMQGKILVLGRYQEWLKAGASPDMIKQVIEQVLIRNNEKIPSTLNYFDKPIADAIAQKNKPMPKGDKHGTAKRHHNNFAKPSQAEQIAEAISRIGDTEANPF